jgi:hypothetical protein
MDEIFYMIELHTVSDGIPQLILVKESQVADIIKNYDRNIYKLASVYGVGKVIFDYSQFLSQNKDLEHGGTDAG